MSPCASAQICMHPYFTGRVRLILEKSDLLLINAKSRDVLPGYLPYGLLWIASVIREEGYGVKIYDRNDETKFSLKEKNYKKILFYIRNRLSLEDLRWLFRNILAYFKMPKKLGKNYDSSI